MTAMGSIADCRKLAKAAPTSDPESAPTSDPESNAALVVIREFATKIRSINAKLARRLSQAARLD